jgi:putative radical SAM enzyme (TIGR03279 family)
LTKVYGGTVSSVEPESIAEEAGILPGDVILSINGHPLYDILDYRFYSTEEEVDILVRRGDEEAVISVEKDFDDPIGVDFTDELFDGVRECGNRCVFCFVHQLPRGMRRPLYIRDDDFRLSFLHGNFVTLTNVDDEDIRRIIQQRLTPLYVSVHATEPKLRNEMVRGEAAPDIMKQLRALAEGGITLHTQIVLCPGVNDKEHLAQTVSDLASLHPAVTSIGVVPVGLTRHRQVGPGLESIDPVGARVIISDVRRWQREFRARYGTRLVWASDELYLVSGVPVPSAATYEGYPQLENGIGFVRRFIDSAKRTVPRLPERIPHPVKATIVTSTLAEPVLQRFVDDLNRVENLSVAVTAVRNEFFGVSVTVSGLLTGGDIRDQMLEREDLSDVVIIPTVMLRDGAFLDDVTVGELSDALKRPVVTVEPTPASLAEALIGL